MAVPFTLEIVAGSTGTQYQEDPRFNVVFDENVARDVLIGTISNAQPGWSYTFNYAPGFDGDGDGRFYIVGNQIFVKAAKADDGSSLFNFETSGIYSMSIIGTPPTGTTGSQSGQFGVYVNDVNDAPTDLALKNATGGTALSVAENQAANTFVGNLTATDEDAELGYGDTLTYSITGNPGNRFKLDATGMKVVLATPLNYNAPDLLSDGGGKYYEVKVRVTDAGGPTPGVVLLEEKVFKVYVTPGAAPTNQAPTDIGLSASAINENSANDVAVGNLSATDPNNGDTFTYALTDNAGGRFKLDAAGTKILVANSALLNHESATSHQITIRVTDQGGLTYTKTLTININNINERPTDLNLSTQNVDENAPGGTSIGTLTGIDQDVGNTFTYTLMNDPDGKFQISGDQLQVKQGASLDYETKAQHTVTVRVTDQNGLFHDRTFTIAVNNLNETPGNQAPTDIGLSASAINENSANDVAVGDLSATDPNNGDTFTYALTDNAGGRFKLDAAGTKILVANSALLNHESATSHQITIRVTDQGGLTYTKTLTININNVNERPTDLNLSTQNVDENAPGGTSIGTLTGIDQDVGNTFTYTLMNDPDGKFQISGDQLQVKQGASLDYETKTQHTVTVRVTDQNGLFHDRTFTIAVNNLNETPGNQAPTGLDLTSTAIDENSGGGTTVGRLTAIDADPNDTFTYSLVSDPDGKFRIAGDELTIKPGATLDYETKQFHQVTIRVKDAAGQTFDKLFTITVNDLPEVPGNRKPTDVNVGGLTTKELAATGTVVSTLTAIDDDANDTFTYQLLNPDGRFKISGNQLIVDNGIKLDHEQAASHQVTVRAYDRAGTFFDKTFSIGVGDVDPEVAVGTALDDVLVGGRGKDNFNGSFGHDKLRGGLGNDVLKGDQGRDIFVFDTKAGKKTNYDKILDYTVKDDSIQLDNVVFKKLGKGAPATPAKLNKKFFTVGTEAKDANDYVIYNKKNGVLSYDADGTGSGRAVEIALLKKNLKITAAEFFVI